MVQGGKNYVIFFGISRMEGEEGVVYPHSSVCEDTLPSSFPPIIYCMSQRISPHITPFESAGATMATMTNTAILLQTSIQWAKTRSMSMWQKRWRMWTNSSFLWVPEKLALSRKAVRWTDTFLGVTQTPLLLIAAWITNRKRNEPHSWPLCCPDEQQTEIT